MTPKQQFLDLCSIVLSVLSVGAAVQGAEFGYAVLSATSAAALVYCAAIEPKPRGGAGSRKLDPHDQVTETGYAIKPPGGTTEPGPTDSLDSWIGELRDGPE